MFALTKRKVLYVVAAAAATFAAIVALGAYWITHSGALPAAKIAVAGAAGISAELVDDAVKFRWWQPWSFKEGTADGGSRFVVCAEGLQPARCYKMHMEKHGSVWTVTDMLSFSN